MYIDLFQYSNGNQTMHEYGALGNRVRTTYYTRKSLTAVTNMLSNNMKID